MPELTCADICDAYAMAAEAHRELTDHVGKPCLYHIHRVAAAVRDFGPKFEIVAALHDSVEDTDMTLDRIKDRFGEEIALAIDAMTHRDGEDYFGGYLPRVLDNAIARRVKFADSTDNLARTMAPETSDRLRKKLQPRYERVLATITAADEKDADHGR